MADPFTSNPDFSLKAFESRFKDKVYIGSGGFSKVYKAFDHAQNKFIALKIADVRPEWKQFTLQREVELVNKLPHHPNIARYDACYRFDMGVAGEIDFAILKFYEDGNLEQFLQKHTLTDEEKLVIVRGILMGVSFLHQNNYIHRDLKSQNILLQREDGVWMPKITDFGLSRSIGSDQTIANSSIGLSYAYAAPEQIQNKKVSRKVDLWAVGVIIYRIIAGELPFIVEGENSQTARSQIELTIKIINQELPKKLDFLPEPYQKVIKACLISDPENRVASANILLDIIDGIDSNQPYKTPTNYITTDTKIDTVIVNQNSALVLPPNQESGGQNPDNQVSSIAPNIPPSSSQPEWIDFPISAPQVSPKTGTPSTFIPNVFENSGHFIPTTPPIPPQQKIVEPLYSKESKDDGAKNENINKSAIPSIMIGDSQPAAKWIWFVSAIFFIGIIFISIYWYLKNPHIPIQNSTTEELSLEILTDFSFDERFKLQHQAILDNDTDKLKDFESTWRNLITINLSCAYPFALATNLAYQNKEEESIFFLLDAANKAFEQSNTEWLLQHLVQEENGSLKLIKTKKMSFWTELKTALKLKNVNFIPKSTN